MAYVMKDYQRLSDKLVELLHLETPPVANFLSPKIPEGVEEFDGRMKWCEMVEVARFEGRTFYSTKEHHTCMNGMYYLGMADIFPGHLTGEWLSGKYPDQGRRIFRSPMAVKRALNNYWRITPNTVNCISYSPLDRCPFNPEEGGLIALVICNPKQAMYLIRGHTFETGDIVMGATMPSTCSTVISRPYLTGELSPSLGCFGARIFMKVKTEEMFIGIPIEILPSLVENLESLLDGRPDLEEMLKEGVGQYHIATEKERQVQRAGWTKE